MDENNYKNIISVVHPSSHHRVKLMRKYDPLGNGSVPDPYYGNERDFDEVFNILNRSIDSLLIELIK